MTNKYDFEDKIDKYNYGTIFDSENRELLKNITLTLIVICGFVYGIRVILFFISLLFN